MAMVDFVDLLLPKAFATALIPVFFFNIFGLALIDWHCGMCLSAAVWLNFLLQCGHGINETDSMT